MSLDPSVNLATEVLDEGPENVETLVVVHLSPILPAGQVANARLAGDPTPFIEVTHMDGHENVEESFVDEVVVVNCLYPKGLGQSGRAAAGQFCDLVHRRMLLLARWLPDVVIGGRAADLEYVDVFTRMHWEPYGDEQILRKVGRYRIGLSYAKMS